MINTQKLWTAIVTPFDDNGKKIDYLSLSNLLQQQQEAGNGVVLFGSTGEGWLLEMDEKKDILHHLFANKSKAQILVGVPSLSLPQAEEFISFCNDLPIAGYFISTPLYTKPGIRGQTKWFEYLLNQMAKPAMLYNVPSRSGVSLYPEVVANLAGHDNFVAIKDSSGDLKAMTEYLNVAPNITLYCSDDDMMPQTAKIGAKGLVSVAANAWPTIVRRYVGRSLNDPNDPDLEIWKQAKVLFNASNPIPIKVLLKYLGLIQTATVRLPLSLEDLARPELLYQLNDNILHWGQKACDSKFSRE